MMPLLISEIYERLQTENLTLVFDTNVITQRGFLPLCQNVQLINNLRIKPYIRLCVSAVAHSEQLFHLAQQYGNNYNLALIREKLIEHNVEILNFTEQEAEYCATLLQQKYTTPPTWQAAKKRRCLECVGLPHEYYEKAEGKGDSCGAPNDWLIMAQAHQGNMILVTNDKGRHGEFDLITNITRYDSVREGINLILKNLPKPISD